MVSLGLGHVTVTRTYCRGRRNAGDNRTGAKNINNGNSSALNSFNLSLLILSVHFTLFVVPYVYKSTVSVIFCNSL